MGKEAKEISRFTIDIEKYERTKYTAVNRASIDILWTTRNLVME